MKNEKENEDLFNLSSSINQYIWINVDLQSLGVLDHNLAGIRNNSISDKEFLHKERCVAESRLIKTKIIYKLSKDIQLSQNEKLYLKEWRKEM